MSQIMKTLLTILFAFVALHVSGSPEDMYSIYDKDGKYRDMQEQMDQVFQKREQAERERETKKNLVLGLAVLMGLFPLAYIGRRIIKEQTWETNPRGTMQALGIALLGGLLLFVVNYAALYLKIIYENEFYQFGPVVIGLVIVAGTIVLLCRSMKQK